jgi:ornithine carbamoyltransferase
MKKKNKHLLTLLDYSKEEITQILNLADSLKADKKAGREHHLLKGKTLGMIFDKSSTRTRVSFEAGMYQLGGHALHLNGKELQMGRGEPVEDTARVLSRYIDGIMIRTFDQELVEKLAKFGSIPVINGLTDLFHPCQVLADLMTMREYLGALEGKKLCFIGDGNNMANSLIIGGLKMGMNVACASPKGYEPADIALAFAREYGDKFVLTDQPLEAAKGADVVVTDVWTSMGQEAETERRKIAFKGYIVDEKLMALAGEGAIVQHCLPAHRGEEISDGVFEAHAGEIFDEAENRLHAQKAVLVTLMGD